MSIGVPRGKTPSVDEWLNQLRGSADLGVLLSEGESDQKDAGYFHTLREIAQQPVTWLETAQTVSARAADLSALVSGVGSFFLTGSGSSLCVGQCLAPSYQDAFRVPATAVAAGNVLTHPREGSSSFLSDASLVLSFARSGDSPESTAVIDQILRVHPRARHLIVTCNADGALATRYRADPRITAVVLDPKTEDRSLVMTSSFTNMFLAARALPSLRDARERAAYVERVERLARIAAGILSQCEALATMARGDFGSAVYLGSGARYGVARESALKMLEMTAGHVFTFAETYLGLRHGPMSAVHRDTLLVCFLSSDPLARAYELDLLRELGDKALGFRKVVIGSNVPEVSADDVVIDTGGPDVDDGDFPALDALVGQLLAFFRCRSLGLRPDSPSPDNVIRRVVQRFTIHRPLKSVS